jgi:hypothetical protein
MRKRCNRCGCFLDPGEWCDCDEQECIDTPRRPVAKKPTIPPREWNSQAYIQQKWLEFDMR